MANDISREDAGTWDFCSWCRQPAVPGISGLCEGQALEELEGADSHGREEEDSVYRAVHR